MYRSLRLLAWTVVFVPCVANAQIASLVTHKDIPACRTIDDGKLLAQAVEMRQLDTFRMLLDSGRCVIWEKGTTIYLDQSVEGCGLTRIRGICEAVYAYTDPKHPEVLIAPLDETWTRRQLPAPASESLTVMLARLQEPADSAEAAIPLPRPRPIIRPKPRTLAQTLADKLAKFFHASRVPPSRARSAYAAPQ